MVMRKGAAERIVFYAVINRVRGNKEVDIVVVKLVFTDNRRAEMKPDSSMVVA